MSCGSWSRVVESGKQKSDGGREEVRSCVVEEGGGGAWSGQGGRGCSAARWVWRQGCAGWVWDGETGTRLGNGGWGMGYGAVGMLRWSQLLHSISVILGCSPELSGLLLAGKRCSAFVPLSPTAGISGWQPLRQGEGERSGVSRAASRSLGLLMWEGAQVCRSSAPTAVFSQFPRIWHPLPRLPGSDSFAGACGSRTGARWRGSLQSSRGCARFDKAPVSCAPAGAAGPGAAGRADPAAPPGAALPVPAVPRGWEERGAPGCRPGQLLQQRCHCPFNSGYENKNRGGRKKTETWRHWNASCRKWRANLGGNGSARTWSCGIAGDKELPGVYLLRWEQVAGWNPGVKGPIFRFVVGEGIYWNDFEDLETGTMWRETAVSIAPPASSGAPLAAGSGLGGAGCRSGVAAGPARRLPACLRVSSRRRGSLRGCPLPLPDAPASDI